MCVDMDSYYASVEVRDNPDLKGKPVAVGVGIDKNLQYPVKVEDVTDIRGAITTCNYEARKFGVKSGMRLSKIKKLCPDCLLVLPRMQHYKEVSEQIMELLGSYVEHDNLEVRSIDEAFLDITNVVKDFSEAKNFGIKIKEEIKTQIGITCSAGIALSKSIAKIASGINKPDGLTVVSDEEVQEFLKDLPVKKIPGIGIKTTQKLKEKFGIETIGHLASIKDIEKLKRIFGKSGIYFYNIARGIDNSKVKPRTGVKSISNQRTFRETISNNDIIKEKLDELSELIFKRLKKGNFEFKTITINVPFDAKKFHSKSISLNHYSSSLETIKKAAYQIWEEFIAPEVKGVRRISLKVSNLRRRTKQKDLTYWFKN